MFQQLASSESERASVREWWGALMEVREGLWVINNERERVEGVRSEGKVTEGGRVMEWGIDDGGIEDGGDWRKGAIGT